MRTKGIPKKKYKMERPKSIPEFAQGLRTHFQILNPKGYLDASLSVITGKLTIDIFALDDYLHRIHGNYEEEQNMSMNGVIEKYYGKAAAYFVDSLI